MLQTTMRLSRTKTHILTVFIILFNQFLPIVTAGQAGHSHPIQSQNRSSYGRFHHPDPSHHGRQGPLHSPKSEEDQSESHNTPLSSPLPTSEEFEFLTAHNKHRSRIGHPDLIWDVNLAAYARWWAKKRSTDCAMLHSRGDHGENIFWGGRDHWKATEVVDLWAGEDEFYDPATNRCQPEQICGHYTQIIWRTSSRLGCSRKRCKTGGVFVICSYDPPGNIHGSSPFSSSRHETPKTESPSLPTIPSPLPQAAAPPSHPYKKPNSEYA